MKKKKLSLNNVDLNIYVKKHGSIFINNLCYLYYDENKRKIFDLENLIDTYIIFLGVDLNKENLKKYSQSKYFILNKNTNKLTVYSHHSYVDLNLFDFSHSLILISNYISINNLLSQQKMTIDIINLLNNNIFIYSIPKPILKKLLI
jgi:hypothetical protein